MRFFSAGELSKTFSWEGIGCNEALSQIDIKGVGAKNGSIFFRVLSLCLSRACLGKMIVFRYKWLKNAVFRRA
jgi:hypothetical protein